MRMTVLGGGGAWPTPERGCSGFLVEAAGFRLLIDPGYATLQPLLRILPADRVDAVFVSHGHGDHCADLNPLLRARHLAKDPPPALPVFALPGALDAILAVDGDLLTADYDLRPFAAGDRFTLGPFDLVTRSLQHFVPNVGLRLSTAEAVMVYTGDGGADSGIVELADRADLFLAEATFPDHVPEESRGGLGSARLAGERAAAGRVKQLVLTHLWPGVDPDAAVEAARRSYPGAIAVARPGLEIDL